MYIHMIYRGGIEYVVAAEKIEDPGEGQEKLYWIA